MIIVATIVTAAIFVLAACASKPLTPEEQQAEIRRAQGEANVDIQPFASTVLDWSNRNLGVDPFPLSLKLLVQGNSQMIRQEYSINPNARVKYSVAQRANRDEARVQAGLLFNAQIANELKVYVVTGAAQTLNQGQMDIVEEITTATKINITGNNRVTDFWQLVETTDDRGVRVREFIYYVVWSMDDGIWDQLVRKYVNDVIGQIPDRQVQINLANAFDDIAAASRREQALDDREWQQMVEQQYQTARNAQQREMTQMVTSASVDIAQAESVARYAAYSSGDPWVARIAATTAADIDWISALRTVASIID
jgi:hypothetical protein